MKIFCIAGELSGDILASDVMQELRVISPSIDFVGVGGDNMRGQGMRQVYGLDRTAFMGVLEVVKNLKTISKNVSECKKAIIKEKPDAAFLIDYSSFNMKMARFCKQKNIKVIYYVSPKYWAWGESRVKAVRKYVDLMLSILPFEESFYKKHNINKVKYVGNPWCQIVQKSDDSFETFCEKQNLTTKPIVAFFPGSRREEVKKMLPVFMETVETFKTKYQFVVGAVNQFPESFYKEFIKESDVEVRYNANYELMSHSKLAVLSSGTVSLECALLGVPQIVCYKVNPLSYIIMKSVVRIKFISLVNICLDFEVVRELIQNDLKSKTLITLMTQILYRVEKRNFILDHYERLWKQLDKKNSSKLAAKYILETLQAAK